MSSWLALAAIALGSIVALAAPDRDGALRGDEVDLLAEPLDPTDPLDDQVQWALRWLHDVSASAELPTRLAPSFLAQLSAEEVAAMQEAVILDAPYTVLGVLDDEPTMKALLLRTATEIDAVLVVSISPGEGDRIDGFAIRPEYVGSDSVTATELNAMIAAGLALGFAGVVRRDRRQAVLFSLGGLLAVGQAAELSSTGWLFTAGLVAGPACLAVAAHGVLRERGTPVLVGSLYAAAALAAAPILVLDTQRFGLPPTPGHSHSPDVAVALLDLRSAAAVVAAGALAWAVGRTAAWRSWTLTPLVVGVLGGALITAAVALWWLATSARLDLTMSPWLNVAAAAPALGVLTAAALEPLGLRDVARFVADLGDEPAPLALQESIARALDDPSVEIAYWSPEAADYLTVGGERWTEPGDDRHVTLLAARGAPLAAVAHDAALGIADERVAAVCAAARIAIDNERLQAEVRARLADVEASRVRIVEAADEARRRIERDLHDGVQQRLLAVLIQLRRTTAKQPSSEPATADELRRAADELAGVLEEVRAIGRGLHPPALDHGLATGLRALAESAALPVEISEASFAELRSLEHRDAIGRAQAGACYFAVAECVANTVRHAGAATHVQVEVRCDPGTPDVMSVIVTDDGAGGADPRAGSGLQRLIDRFAALGGACSITSPTDGGTRITWSLPLRGLS